MVAFRSLNALALFTTALRFRQRCLDNMKIIGSSVVIAFVMLYCYNVITFVLLLLSLEILCI